MEIALVTAVFAAFVLGAMLLHARGRAADAEHVAEVQRDRMQLMKADLDYARESIRVLEPLAAVGRAAQAQRKAASDAAAAKRRAKKAA